MKLSEWVTKEVKEKKSNKTAVLKDLSENSGVSLVTLQSVAKGMPLSLYQKARSVQDATNQEVTVQELCE